LGLLVALTDWGNTKAKEEEKNKKEEKKKKDSGGWGCGSWVGCCKRRWICFSVPKNSFCIGRGSFLRGFV
jgi:hypothetical protein